MSLSDIVPYLQRCQRGSRLSDKSHGNYIPSANSGQRRNTTYAHVYVPGWISHDDVKLAEHAIIKLSDIAVDPLRGILIVVKFVRKYCDEDSLI